MWTTLDGIELTITPAALRQIAARHRQSGLADLVRRAYRENILSAVRRTVGRLVAAAYRSGSIIGASGRRYRTFEAQLGGRTYRLFARPLGAGSYTLVAVRPGPEREAAGARHGGEVTVEWTPPLTIDRAAAMPAGGIYVLERGGVPVNVGQGGVYAGPDGRIMRKAGQAMRDLLGNPDDYRVRLGLIRGGTARQRQMVEHTTILDLNRDLSNANLPLLTNVDATRPYRVAPHGVTIHHTGVLPAHLSALPADPGMPGARLQQIPGGATYQGLDPTVRPGAQLPLFPTAAPPGRMATAPARPAGSVARPARPSSRPSR
ncbi:MAG: hypothetical protein HXY37_01160, partial [Chloroflexi bacterium]|nr:hypothetical protein [Chloroflexota bacterium]